MRGAHTTTGSRLANTIALLSPKKNNRRVRLCVLSFCVIASLVALGFGMAGKVMVEVDRKKDE